MKGPMPETDDRDIYLDVWMRHVTLVPPKGEHIGAVMSDGRVVQGYNDKLKPITIDYKEK